MLLEQSPPDEPPNNTCKQATSRITWSSKLFVSKTILRFYFRRFESTTKIFEGELFSNYSRPEVVM